MVVNEDRKPLNRHIITFTLFMENWYKAVIKDYLTLPCREFIQPNVCLLEEAEPPSPLHDTPGFSTM